MQYKPSDAAKLCNTSANTIRNWCRDYAAFLSPGASGVGGDRLLTERDISTLQYIAQLRAEKMQLPEITARLQEASIGDIETLVPSDPQTTFQVPSNPPEGLQQTQGVIVAIESLRSEIEAIRQTRVQDMIARRDNVTWFAIGFMVAGFIFLGMVLLSWLYSG